MSDKIQKVIQRSQAAAHHLVHTSEPFDFKKAGKLNLKENHNHVQHRNVKFQVVNPSNQPASPLQSGSSIFTDFRVNSSEPVQQMWIQCDLLCDASFDGTPAPITDSLVWNMIDRIEMLAENGSVVLQQVSGAAMECRHFAFDESQYRGISNALRGANTNQSGLTLDAGESGTIYIPLLFNILADNEIAVSALNSAVTIRLYWRSGADLSGDSYLIDVTSTNLIIQEYQYDSSVRSKIFQKLMGSTPCHFRFPRQGKMELTASVTPGTPYDMRLSGIHGLVTELTVEFLISDVTTELDSVDLFNSSGNTLLGSRMKTRFLLASREVAHPTFVQAGKGRRYLRIPISADSTEAYAQNGNLNAYHVFNGNDSLSITYVASDGSTTPVNATIRVYFSAVSTMEVKGGVVSVQHS
jgi:hypothetical protein